MWKRKKVKQAKSSEWEKKDSKGGGDERKIRSYHKKEREGEKTVRELAIEEKQATNIKRV